MPNNTFKIEKKSLYPYFFIIISILFIIILILYPDLFSLKIEMVAATLGLFGGFFGFLYSQHNHQTEIFIDLFDKFNCRYDKLNDNLNKIRAHANQEDFSLNEDQKNILSDYMNLCGEEYLYYKAGYIDKRVWDTWKKGMDWYCNEQEAIAIWNFFQEEFRTQDYYGLNQEFQK